MTSVHAAAAAPDASVLRLLLTRGISFEVRDQIGTLPIHVAAFEGKPWNVQFLVEEAGMDPRQRRLEGDSPLDIAVLNGHLPVVHYLVEEAGVDLSDPDQIVSSACSDLWLAPWLLEFQSDFSVGLGQGSTSLHLACASFQVQVAEYLLDQPRIDPLAKNKNENHALMLALRDIGEGEAPDQGLPILELFQRKAPQALDLPGEEQGTMGCAPCPRAIVMDRRRSCSTAH